MRFWSPWRYYRFYNNITINGFKSSNRHLSTQSYIPKIRKYSLYTAGLCLISGVSIYYCYNPFISHMGNLKKIDESIFNNSDNLFVLVFNSSSSNRQFSDLIDKLKSILDCPELKHVKLCYTIRTESQDSESPIAILYKGLRKKSIPLIDREINKDEIVEFYKPQSEEDLVDHIEYMPENVTLNNFNQKVVDSSVSEPVLLQLFEDGCFLCFLMRPFINSVHRILREGNHKLSIKRLNVEKNDFPENCPVSRATPTFILYDRRNVDKWDEFKPQNLVDKLNKILKLSQKELKELDALVQKIPKRLQLIADLTHWQAEILSLDHLGLTSDSDYLNEGDTQSLLLKDIMEQDMKLHDSLDENIAHMEKAIVMLEGECILIAQDVAKELIDKFNY